MNPDTRVLKIRIVSYLYSVFGPELREEYIVLYLDNLYFRTHQKIKNNEKKKKHKQKNTKSKRNLKAENWKLKTEKRKKGEKEKSGKIATQSLILSGPQLFSSVLLQQNFQFFIRHTYSYCFEDGQQWGRK